MGRPWLETYRKSKDLTHEQVAGIARSTYTLIESGIRNPSVDSAKRIAKVVGFKWTLFFEQNCHERQQESKSHPAA